MNHKKPHVLFTIILMLLSFGVHAQFEGADPFAAEDDDLNIGGDIFSDFNEDLESSQIAEDERFFRYGRFFSIQFGIGLTTFNGNRGQAYNNKIPSLTMSYNYFQDFLNSYGLGIGYSRHSFFLGQGTQYRGFASIDDVIGEVDVSMVRTYFHYRRYIDTSNLGTAITYSNPYLTGRMEYWYIYNKFPDEVGADDNGGGFGFGVGFGFDFPVELKKSYINLEILGHFIPFHDIDTVNYQCNQTSCGDTVTYDDLSGTAFTTMVSYVINW